MDNHRIPDGLEVRYESGLEAVAPTTYANSSPSRAVEASSHLGKQQTLQGYEDSVPPPAYNYSAFAPPHDSQGQYAPDAWDNRGGGEHAPIPVDPVAEPTQHQHKYNWDSETAPIAFRPEDSRRHQIAALQTPDPNRRLFGYRRKVFYAIFGTATIVSIIVIAVAISISLKRAKAKNND